MNFKDSIYHVACSTDNQYAQHCGIMLYSLLSNNPNHIFHIHILIENLNQIIKDELMGIIEKHGSICSFHVVNSEKLQGVKFRKKNPLSYAAYYRLLFCSIFDNSISKVLYLDCDIIVLKEVTTLWEINLNNYSLAAVRDSITLPKSELHRNQLGIPYGGDYFNSGVMLINLDYWREHNVENELLKFAKQEREVFFHDQDALNFLFKNTWLKLSPKWNYMNMAVMNDIYFPTISDKIDFIKNPCIIHYASTNNYKPWKDTCLLPMGNYYRRYKDETIWKNTPLEPINISRVIFYKNILVVHMYRLLNKSPYVIRFIVFLIRDLCDYMIKLFFSGIYAGKAPY